MPALGRVRVRVVRRHGVRERFVAMVARAIVAATDVPAVPAWNSVAAVDVARMVLAPVGADRRATLRTPFILIVEVGGTVDATRPVPVLTRVGLVSDCRTLRVAVGPHVAVRLKQTLRGAVTLNPLSIRFPAHDCDSFGRCSHASLMGWPMFFRALAGLEPACVPLGLGSQSVSSAITLSVSASVAPLRTMAVTVGVSM